MGFQEEQPGDLLAQFGLMGFQEEQPGLCGGGPLSAEAGVLAHLGDRHARLAQPQQELHPGDVGPAVAAVPSGVARDGPDQPGPLVVAQGVRRHPGCGAHLRDSQLLLVFTHTPRLEV